MRIERRVVAIKRRAIWADDFVLVAHIEKDVRMIERRLGTNAHEFVRADLDHRNTGIVVEMWNDVIRHAPARLQWFGTAFAAAAHHNGPDARFLACSPGSLPVFRAREPIAIFDIAAQSERVRLRRVDVRRD